MTGLGMTTYWFGIRFTCKSTSFTVWELCLDCYFIFISFHFRFRLVKVRSRY
jgi:hypothetical protein